MAEEGKKGLAIMAEADKIIPKLATNVNFTKLEDGSVVIRFVAQHPTGGPAALIETIVVDAKHAQNILEVLTKVLSGAPEKKSHE